MILLDKLPRRMPSQTQSQSQSAAARELRAQAKEKAKASAAKPGDSETEPETDDELMLPTPAPESQLDPGRAPGRIVGATHPLDALVQLPRWRARRRRGADQCEAI